MAKTYNPIITLTPERLASIKKYLEDKKVINQEKFAKFLQELFNFKKLKAGTSKVSYLRERNPELFKGKDFLTIPQARRLANLDEYMKDDVFNTVMNDKLKKLGKKKFLNLTKDQQDTIIDSYKTALKDKKLIPKNSITEADFLSKVGETKSNINAYLSKDTRLGTKFQEIFKPNRLVLNNKASFYKPEGLENKIKQWKTFRDKGFLQEGTVKRANIFKNDSKILR